MSFSKLQEINTTTYDNCILISQTSEKWDQESFVLTFAKTPLPDIKKRSGSSELQVAVPSQEDRKIEKDLQPNNIWPKPYFRELFLRPPFVLAFMTQAPLKYLYNPQNHDTMAETKKPKHDKQRTALKKKLRDKISSCGINLESERMITNGKPEISNREKTPSKLSHKSELFMKPNATSQTNLEFNNSKITIEMYPRNDKEKSINSKEANNEATNKNAKKSSEEFSDDTSKYINIPNRDLLFLLGEFRTSSIDLEKRIQKKISSWAKNQESPKMKTDGKPEISNREKILSRLSHKSELFKKSNVTSETNVESKNSKISMEMYSRNDDKNLMNSKRINIFWKGNPNSDSRKSSEKFPDDTSECVSSSNTDLELFLNEFRSESSDLDEWLTNYSHNNAKKPAKKAVKKDSDPDSGDSKGAKKEGKKKEKKEVKKKKDLESTDAESGDSKDTKKDPKRDKKEEKEVKKKKAPDSTDADSSDIKDLQKAKKEKTENKKNAESSDAGSVDSKDANKEKKLPKKDDKKEAFHTDTESDVESKKDKKGEKNKKLTKDAESSDADSESEVDPKAKKGEKKDKKVSKKGEKKNAKIIESSDSEIEVKKKKKEAMKDSMKNIVSNTDSATDASSKSSVRIGLRPSGTESEGSLGFKVVKTTDDSDTPSTDMKKGTSHLRRRFRTSYKKTTFGGKDVASKIPSSSRERLPFPPCEPFQTSRKPKRVCQCMNSPPPPKPRYAPLPGVEWIHKLL